MFAVTVTLHIQKEDVQLFLPLMQRNAQASLDNEPGCLRFDICTDADRPNEVFLYEIYKNAAAFDTHLSSPHFIAFDIETGPMIAAKTVKTYRQVVA